MNPPPLVEKLPAAVRRRPVLWSAAALVLIVFLFLVLRSPRADVGDTAFHLVKRGDFTVSVVEAGTLAAVKEVIIRSEVEGTARIISIVPEGSYVKKGDLLVELDSSQAQDQVNQQEINVEKARFAVTNALAQLEIARSTTNSDFLSARIRLESTTLERDKYLQGQRLVDMIEASNRIVTAQAQLAVNLQTYHYTTNLAAKGYETRTKVDGDGLSVTNTRNSLTIASNNIFMLTSYDIPRLTLKYESDVKLAEQELERVVNQNKRRMDQNYADLNAQMNTLKLSEDKLERDKRNLTNTVIRAPQDGLVVYQVSENRFSSESLIEGGAVVRNRQDLIKLPDLSRMKVTVKVHESHINNVRPGLPAVVVLDSMPDLRFAGTVEKVAPLPDTQTRFGNPNLKVYNTEIYLTETLPDVKPGVSAKAEIIITNIANAVSVPVQAVASLKGRPVVYLVDGDDPKPQPVELGLFNTKFIQITSGVEAGNRVLLSPPFDTQAKSLEGSLAASEDKARLSTTNAPRPSAATSASQPTATTQQGARPEAQPAAPATVAAEGNAAAGRGNRQGGGPGGGFNREEMLKQYDKDGDGELNESEREAMRSAMQARFGGQGGGPGGGFNREEMLKRFDTDGDGELNETERAAMRAAMPARQGGQGGGFNREEMLKRFDTDGDGELSESERAAMREATGSRTNRTERRRNAEAPAAGQEAGDGNDSRPRRQTAPRDEGGQR